MDARVVLDKMSLAYLASSVKYWITQDERSMMGLNPNHLCLDADAKIALGLIFKSSTGHDYSIALRMIELLKKLNKENDHDCYIASLSWNDDKPHLLYSNPLSTIATRVSGAKWLPPTNGYVGPYVWLTEDLHLANMQRAKLPF